MIAIIDLYLYLFLFIFRQSKVLSIEGTVLFVIYGFALDDNLLLIRIELGFKSLLNILLCLHFHFLLLRFLFIKLL